MNNVAYHRIGGAHNVISGRVDGTHVEFNKKSTTCAIKHLHFIGMERHLIRITVCNKSGGAYGGNDGAWYGRRAA